MRKRRDLAWPWLLGPAMVVQMGCGLKGPPQPPLSRAPEPVRGLELRQSGASIELRWYPPTHRQDGRPLADELSYQVLGRAVDRAAAGDARGAPAVSAPTVSASPGAATDAIPPARGSASGLKGIVGRERGAGAARIDEDLFLKSARVVTTVRAPGGRSGEERGGSPMPSEPGSVRPPGTGLKTALPAAPVSASIGAAEFPGLRLTATRLALAVVAVDAKGRRSPPHPIVEIDPVVPLPPPLELSAAGSPDGVRLSWKLPALDTGAGAVGVNIYRSGSDEERPTIPPQLAIAGGPFKGESAVDPSASFGNAYAYEARLVALSPGKGLRESPPSTRATLEYRDLFPPDSPSLVTIGLADSTGAREGTPGALLAWSGPIDADVAGYRIERAEEEAGFSIVSAVPASASSWLDGAVREGRRYRYRVVALDGATPPNASAPSEAVEIVIPGSPAEGRP